MSASACEVKAHDVGSPAERASLTSLGRKVGRNLGKSLKTSLPRASLLSLLFSSRAGLTFSPFDALGLYAGGTCKTMSHAYMRCALCERRLHPLYKWKADLPWCLLNLSFLCLLDSFSLSPCSPAMHSVVIGVFVVVRCFISLITSLGALHWSIHAPRGSQSVNRTPPLDKAFSRHST